MSKLVIVESPAKAKNIKGYLGRGYDVIASMGHVRDLPAARLSVDIANDFEPKYAVIKGKENFVKDLKKKADSADYVYLATDPDREGEAISWHLATLLGLDLNDENRVTFNEITKNGVKNGMANPRKIDIWSMPSRQEEFLTVLSATSFRRLFHKKSGAVFQQAVCSRLHFALLLTGKMKFVHSRLKNIGQLTLNLPTHLKEKYFQPHFQLKTAKKSKLKIRSRVILFLLNLKVQVML